MKRRITIAKLACASMSAFFTLVSLSPARAEEPSAAVDRFYSEYMGSGVALKPLGDRWFTSRFRDIMNAWDSDPLQKPLAGNPILPWKDWDAAWRNKLKTKILQASLDRALIVVTFATDEKGRPIARLVHLEKVEGDWRVDDVSDPPSKDD